MTEIIPNKVIIELNPDGTVKDGLIQYRLSVDGVIQNQYRTMGIMGVIDNDTLNGISTIIQEHVERGENIT
ncbi:MAG TPA: hypothetical protein PKL77_10125 [Candidatus Omnitrophota bacterium]|nr:hypothetical protein [Candidatus Omnitrophota bacterium]